MTLAKSWKYGYKRCCNIEWTLASWGTTSRSTIQVSKSFITAGDGLTIYGDALEAIAHYFLCTGRQGAVVIGENQRLLAFNIECCITLFRQTSNSSPCLYHPSHGLHKSKNNGQKQNQSSNPKGIPLHLFTIVIPPQ